MKLKTYIYFKCRQSTKDRGITGQTQIGSTIAPTPRGLSPGLKTWINKSLAESRKHTRRDDCQRTYSSSTARTRGN